MSAHTPGPWTVGGPTGFLNQLAIDPSIGCVYGAGDEIKANARLIAAAPDMLEALEKAVLSLNEIERVLAILGRDTIAATCLVISNSLRNVIFKAKGEL